MANFGNIYLLLNKVLGNALNNLLPHIVLWGHMVKTAVGDR